MKILERTHDDLLGPCPAPARPIEIPVGSEDIDKTVWLPVLSRDQPRRRLRTHPKVKRHVERLDTISRMSKPELPALPKKVGINAKALIERVTEHGEGMESVLEEDELER